MNNRKSVVSGHFYSNNKIQLEHDIEVFSKKIKNSNVKQIQVLIVPHAGYIYSGYTANLAYNNAKDFEYENIVIIGPSHRVSFEGVSVACFDSFETPLGKIKINEELSQELLEEFSFVNFYNKAHEEHSTETQAPFIKYYFKKSKLVELVYSNIKSSELLQIIKKVLEKEKTLVVISTDLSHFLSLEKANKVDSFCIEAIEKVDSSILDKGAQACGFLGLKASLDFAKEKNLKTKMLNYTTSAKVNNDEDRVVGYLSAIIGK